MDCYTYCAGARSDVQDCYVVTPFDDGGVGNLLLTSIEKLGRDLGCRIPRLAFLGDSRWQDGFALADRPRVSMLLSDWQRRLPEWLKPGLRQQSRLRAGTVVRVFKAEHRKPALSRHTSYPPS